MPEREKLPFDDSAFGRRRLVRDSAAFISVFPLLGSLERWVVQEFSYTAAPATIFNYTSQSDIFIYGLKVSMTRFEYQIYGGVRFYVNQNRLAEPTAADPSFPIGNGMENLFPFHLHLKRSENFRVEATQGATFAFKDPIAGIVHMYGALV